MKIEQDRLNEWARTAWRLTGRHRTLLDDLRRMEAPADLQDGAGAAQRLAVTLLHDLLRAGADDPAIADKLERYGPEVAAEFEGKPVPLELLTTPAARRFATAIRHAAEACRDMESERGIEDGLAELLEDYAADAELEVYGPPGIDSTN